MKSSIGSKIRLTVFGESHGSAVGVIIDGLAPGIPVDCEFIKSQLAKRRPQGKTDTPRVENDNFQILSGVFEGKTTGTPIAIVIPNENTKSKDYNYGVARPSHADYTAYAKYHGYEDYRGGGHFSGRVTAGLVAGGAIALSALKNLGINIGTHILSCAGERDRAFGDVNKDVLSLQDKSFPVLDDGAEDRIVAKITEARENKDSVGGIKGVEFGLGEGFASLYGSQANDSFEYKDGRVVTTTNNSGGVNGGITNGMPITFTCTVKPTPSIAKEQSTVDFIKGENATLEIKGRHDPAIIRRICPVVDSLCALVICDMLATRFGTDFLNKN